jgi:hypothetical protein
VYGFLKGSSASLTLFEAAFNEIGVVFGPVGLATRNKCQIEIAKIVKNGAASAHPSHKVDLTKGEERGRWG